MITIRPAGDLMLLVEVEPRIDPVLNERVIRLAERIRGRRLPGVRDVVPAYRSIGVHFDPLLTDLAGLEQAIDEDARTEEQAEPPAPRPLFVVPVRYGGEHGPDLATVAEWAGLSEAEVVARHTEREYRVYMLGFVPGFAYLGSVDPGIAAPRRRVPREKVPAGSVGIAGEQTGVYPIATPGGWQIIGRTDTVLFDPAESPPNRLSPGDQVRFVAVEGVGVP